MRDALILVVVLAVVSAGCGASDSTPDREPYGVDEFGPPGLTEDGVTDSAALVNAHYGALEGKPFYGHYRLAVRDDTGSNVSVWETNQTITSDAASVRVEYDSHDIDPDSGRTVATHTWIDGDAEYVREVNASGAVTYRPNWDTGWTEPNLPVSIHDLYDATDTVAVERTNGTERYRLEGTGDLRDVENASFEVVLAEAGFVETFRVEGTQLWDGERVTVEYTGGFDRIDDRELEEPEWVDEAEKTWAEDVQQ